MKTYEVVIERDKRGWWIASVPAVAGCFAQGKTLLLARQRIVEALQFRLGGKQKKARFEIADRVQLPAPTRKAVATALESRELAERASNESRDAMRRAALLLKEKGISQRDAAELLGVSHQRVQQLRTRGLS